MNSALEKLCSIGAAPLGNKTEQFPSGFPVALQPLYLLKNGFFACESALQVFPIATGKPDSAENWNSPGGWKKEFDGMLDSFYCFAQDVFGFQFCVNEKGFYLLDTETGKAEFLAPDAEAWAAKILEDLNFYTGYPLAHEWQMKNGPLPTGKRLAPKMPFVGGGDFALPNLYLADTLELLSFRAHLAKQIKNLPDGAKIKFKFTD